VREMVVVMRALEGGLGRDTSYDSFVNLKVKAVIRASGVPQLNLFPRQSSTKDSQNLTRI
jgi:hypothetical protein